MQNTIANHHVWLNMPEELIADHLEHDLRCKQAAPHSTSACVLVPARFGTSYKRRSLNGMHLIMQIFYVKLFGTSTMMDLHPHWLQPGQGELMVTC